MAPRSTSWLAGPLHISYPIKAPPAHAFQLQTEIYCPGASLIQQDAGGTEQQERRKGSGQTRGRKQQQVHMKSGCRSNTLAAGRRALREEAEAH